MLNVFEKLLRSFADNDKSKDYDSTTSTPKVEHKILFKNMEATKIKPTKSKFTMTLGITSTHPNSSLTKRT